MKKTRRSSGPTTTTPAPESSPAAPRPRSAGRRKAGGGAAGDKAGGAARPEGHARFFARAAPLLARSGVTESTMMGFPCLRYEGAFFASVDREGAHVVLKLDAGRVAALLASGEGLAFAPSGRRFKEWVAVPIADEAGWARLLDEAYAFVSSS